MKKLIVFLLAVIIFCLGGTTFVEKYRGTEYVQEYIYGSLWFCVLWGVLATASLVYITKRRLYRNLPAFLLHLAFMVILAGALLTSLTARHGIMHVRVGDTAKGFLAEGGGEYVPLPFEVRLDSFDIVYYPGTQAPADYVSRFTVSGAAAESCRGRVSMNRIFSYRGIRLYQSSFDADMRGSSFAVNSDPVGIPVTYLGYFLLFASLLAMLAAPGGQMRRLLGNPLLRKGIFAVAFCLAASGSFAANEPVLSRGEAGMLGKIQVLHNDRITLLQTLAYDFTLKLTGKSRYRHYTPEQVLSGWLFFPEHWKNEPMIYVKSKELRRLLKVPDYAAFGDFFTERGSYRLEALWQGLRQVRGDSFQKAVAELDEKIQLILMVRNGTMMRVFPQTEPGRTVWYAPASALPESVDGKTSLFIRCTFDLAGEAAAGRDTAKIRFILSKLATWQHKNAGTSLMPASRVNAEFWYNRIPFTGILFKLNLAAGLCALLWVCYGMLMKRESVSVCVWGTRIFYGLAVFSFVMLSVCLALRGYISGRLPMGNGYETMVLMAWCLLLTTLAVGRRFRFILAFGLLLSGFCLLVASLNQMNPQITPLMPVLSSPLLSLHVSLIMMAYALLAFTFLNGLLALLIHAWGHGSGQAVRQLEVLSLLSRVFLLPALALLGAGIFIGAVWANVSWGKYWSWDPKEVWALITFLVYAGAVHTDSLPLFRKPVALHVYLCCSFLTVLMTYFGVNYFLGGMHSYAG